MADFGTKDVAQWAILHGGCYCFEFLLKMLPLHWQTWMAAIPA